MNVIIHMNTNVNLLFIRTNITTTITVIATLHQHHIYANIETYTNDCSKFILAFISDILIFILYILCLFDKKGELWPQLFLNLKTCTHFSTYLQSATPIAVISRYPVMQVHAN